MALKFAMIVQMVERVSAPGKRVTATVTRMTRGVRDLARGSPAAGRGLDRLGSAAARMQARLRTSLARVRALAGRAGMKALEKSAYGAGVAIGWTIRKVATLAGGLAKLAAGGIGLATGGFFGGVIATTAKFEQFQIMLEGIEGSSQKAKASMDWVRNFAKTTPYELDQVMEAFVQLKAYGIDPLDGALAAAGDAAAGMSKPLMQAIEALADAQTGEFERLKEFGIRARVEGDKVAFTYMKNGKEISRTTSKNAAEMKSAITGIWSERFGGMMDRQSRTLNGMISNLKDGWSDFMLRVGQAGVFDKVKGKLQSVLDWLNAKLADGSIDRWADTVSKKLEEIVDWAARLVEDTDWSKFATDLGNVASAAWTLAKGLASAVNWAAKLLSTQDQIAKNGATTTVDGGFFRIRRANEAPPPAAKPAIPAVRSSPRASPVNLRGTKINPGASTPQKVAVGGKMTVELKAPPGWSARPTQMSSANSAVPLVYRGGAMAGNA